MMNLEGLNNMQKEAVLHTEGPLLIIAGAGSGKTRVLTYRIAYLIEDLGIDPYNILAITFTNKAANEMKERVCTISESGSGVWVSTFHSMCVRMLRRFAERIGYSNDFTIYDSDDAKSLMRDIFKSRNINTKYYKEKSVLNSISSAKNIMQTPQEMLSQAGSDLRLKTVAELYIEYQERLKLSNAMDFDDLIFNTVTLLKNDSEVRCVFAERFRYIMVDEYQDTNMSQFLLVELLASVWKNLCVVGDDDQSIYKFRGADVENILNFEKAFPGTSVIKLEQNYRSTQTILDAANDVIKNNSKRKDKKLWTDNDKGSEISLLMFDNAYNEAEGIARSIENLTGKGRGFDEIAILYRTNAQSRMIEEKLVLANIPYRIFGGVNFYQRREIKDIISYLKLIVNNSDTQAVKRIINVPKRGIGQTTTERIQNYADAAGISFWDALCMAKDIPDIGNAYKKTDAFVELIDGFKESAKILSIQELTSKILEDISYIEMLAETETREDFEERRENIDELINKIIDFEENYSNLQEPEDKDRLPLNMFLEDVSLVAQTGNEDGNTRFVSLMTLHSAKGLEFPVVYMAGMEDGLFPSFMAIGSAGEDDSELEEERRLCYVGITRAMEKLIFTFARERMIRGDRHTSTISRFVREINPILIQKENNSLIGDDFGFEEAPGTGAYMPKNKAKYSFRSGGASAGLAYGSVKRQSQGSHEEEIKKEIKTAPSFGKLFTKDTRISPKPVENLKTHPTKSGTSSGKSIQSATFEKNELPPFTKGERVSNDRFGEGSIVAVEDMGRDWLLTVDFDETGIKKMFAGFINLKKIE